MKKEIKMYKCYSCDGSYSLLFSVDGETFNSFNDLSGGNLYYKPDFTKVEPLEKPDTLQEYVEWCWENGKEVCIGQHNFTYISDCFDSDTRQDEFKPTELLQHIRTPKLKQITPEQLAEMGYEIKDDNNE